MLMPGSLSLVMRLEGMMVLNVELKWTNSILKQELVLSSCERTKGSGHGESVRCPPDLAIGQMEFSRVAGRDIYIYIHLSAVQLV